MRSFRGRSIAQSLIIAAAFPSLAVTQERGPASSYEEGESPAFTISDRKSDAALGEAEWRHPVALALSVGDRWLYVACRRSGSLVVMDLVSDKQDPVAIHRIGGRPEAMAMLANGELAIADGSNDCVHLVGMDGARISRRRTIWVGCDPRQLTASRDGATVWVSLRGDRSIVALDAAGGHVLYRCQLAFAPHCLTLDPRERWLLVADAFRGNLAAIDARSGDVLAMHSFPGTNIRGLAFEPDGSHFVMAHQIVSERSVIEREQIRWGAFITNNVRRIPTDVFLTDSDSATQRSDLQFIGDFGKGAGDPGRFLVPTSDVVAVCLSGVNQIGLDTGWPLRFTRIGVGRRPVDLALDAKARRAYVANQFDDTISVVDVADRSVIRTISLGPLPVETPEMRGEILFHDASVSLDNWYSCQSCHTDGQTNGVNADTFGDGGVGAPKNTPSLLGVARTGPWSWTGRFDTIEDQIASTIEHTMQGPRLARSVTSDLAAFLATLEAPNHSRRFANADSSRIERGRAVFKRQGCAECHAGESLTAKGVFDVGLDDGRGGNTHFNPPSLRGVADSAPYLHDGRAPTLESVFREHRHPSGETMEEDELELLLAYLRRL